ncbi:minor capsid protein [Eubacterium callanderi]|uniref:minor capsid protein n=1 Tax=Eubacterium callanderi TaxID=53442 RepID=UPI001C0F8263|nr:minor capsid protein [Eubacterium callanderi]MBU5306051.1 minor capsid protein [Eubacterium callanderi]
MARKNSEYWEKRIADKTTWRLYNTLEEKNRALLEMYQDATREINSAIYELGEKLSKSGQIKRSDLYKYNHLKNLQAKMNSILKTLGGTIEEFASGNMENAFKENYSDILKSLGKKGFDLPNKKLMEELLKKPWFGGNFSDRLWGNTEKLAQILNSELRQGLQQGKTTTEVAAKIATLMQSSFNSAHRLVRTETMHYLNQSSLEAYKAGGVQFVQFWAAMDERTCSSCGALHGKIYAIDKVPVLPLHAHCRCTYLPVTDPQMIEKYLREEVVKSAKGGIINTLPDLEHAVMPEAKFTKYALDQARQPDKAKALELALGYTQKNHRELMENIQRNLSHFPAVYKGTDGYGDRYEIEMMLVGANGRVARLMTGWIIDKEKRETRLTSVYINKRKKG